MLFWIVASCARNANAVNQPANPAFSPTDSGAILHTHNFGTVRQGSPSVTDNFSVYNINVCSCPTAPMTLVDTQAFGSTSAFSLQTGTISGLPAGGSSPVQLSINTSQPGNNLSISYSLEFASDGLPAAPHKSLAVVGFLTILRRGDYDGDGDVDNADLALWKSNFGTTNSASDGNENGTNDAPDYVVWRRNFTGPMGSDADVITSAAVPEASAALLAIIAAGMLAVGFRHSSMRLRAPP
jgi:hypothetical protein